MKNFTLAISMLLLSVMASAQNNPCPDLQAYGFFITSNPPSCAAYIYIYATGDVQSQKGLGVKCYVGPTATGTPIVDVCFIVPKSSPSTLYQTPVFSFPCSDVLTYVITRYTASNGLCGGGTCGVTVTTGGPLPIKISSFFAKRNGNAVVLNWTSESEINAKEFVIERNSGSGFVAIGTVAALNRETGSSYTYTDNNNSSKTVSQYRLKLVDKDASYKLSEIRPVKGTAAVSDFIVFPNPSMGNAKVSITDIAEATTVDVIDNAGRVLKTIELQNKNTVDINNLQKGIYLIRITNKVTGDVLTKKLTVSN